MFGYHKKIPSQTEKNWSPVNGIIQNCALEVIAKQPINPPKFKVGDTVVVNYKAPILFSGWEVPPASTKTTDQTPIVITKVTLNTSYILEILTYTDINFYYCLDSVEELKQVMERRINKRLNDFNAKSLLYYSYKTTHPTIRYEIAEPFLLLQTEPKAEILKLIVTLENLRDQTNLISDQINEILKKIKTL